MKKISIFITILLLYGCQASQLAPVEQLRKMHRDYSRVISAPGRMASSVNAIKNVNPHSVASVYHASKALTNMPLELKKDTKALDRLINSLTGNAAKKWGKGDVIVAGQKDYVKYLDGYLSRAHIDFTHGSLTVETVAKKATNEYLKRAIVMTLLTPNNPNEVDLFSDASIKTDGVPFLFGQIKDFDNKPIRWQWRANRYANFLVKNRKLTRVDAGRTVTFIKLDLVKNHESIRKFQYAALVKKASRRYNVAEDLIYGIIKTESSFNPYAVSRANAYGLMQVVPRTAGRDVYQKIRHRSGQPSAKVLFSPAQNIDIGTAYLHILQDIYLKQVKRPLAKEYSVISAYNGGAGNVFKTFNKRSRTRALHSINSLTAKQLYWALTHRHPSSESRRYLQKVTKNRKDYFKK